MRLGRATLRNFKGFGELDTEFGPGLNVVHGPNEAGKSSFLDALRAAFFESAKTTSRSKVGRWIPWGTDAVPEVAVEFEAGGTLYRVSKRFAGAKGTATLDELPAGTTLADGPRQVEDRLGEILKMGDAAFLCSSWVEQGGLEDALDKAGGAPDLRARLREAGADATSPVDIERMIRSRRKSLSLPSALGELEREGERASREAERVRDALWRWREREDRADAAAARLSEIDERLGEIVPRLEEDAKYAEASKSLEGAKRDLAAAKSALDGAEEAGHRLEELVRRLAEAEAALARSRARGEAAKAELASAQSEARRKHLDEVLAKVSALDRDGADLEATARAPSPDSRELAALDAAVAKTTELKAKLEAAELRVEVEALGEIEIVTPSESGALAPGQLRELKGDSEVSFEIPSVARVRARGPVQDLSGLRDELADSRRRIAGALERYGVSDLAEARDLAARAAQARRDLGRIGREREGLLGGRALAALEDERAALGAALGEDAPRARDEADIQAELASAREEYGAAAAGAKDAREQIAFWKEKRSDVARLRKAVEDASLRCLAAETAARRHERYALPAEDELTLSRERQRLEREQGELQALVKMHREDRPPFTDEDLARAQEDRGEVERRLRVLDREERALALVRDAARRAREELAVSDEEIIHACVERLLPRLTAERYSSADLNEQFEVETVSGPAHEGAPVGDLSAGAREQVALAMRLAMVEALSGTEPQLVVLDEAFLGFDPERTRAACGLLAEYADRFQIVVMTARPEALEFPPGTEVKDIRLGADA